MQREFILEVDFQSLSPVVGILKMADGSDRRAGTMDLRRRPTPNFSAVQYRGGLGFRV